MKQPNWTKEEDELLKVNIDKVKIAKDLAPLFPTRSISAVIGRVYFLKLIKHKEYTKNDSFFEIPNTLNSSISGFIASDGHLCPYNGCKSSARLSFGLNSKDKSLLENINKILGSNYKISDTVLNKKFNDKKKGIIYEYIDRKSSLHISNCNKWIEDLKKNWNIPSGKKSLILEPPYNLKDMDCCLAYICGLISGDGTILITGMKGEQYARLSLIGTEKLMYWVKDIYEKFLNKKINVNIHKRDNIFNLTVHGINAAILIDKINSLNVLRLDRKWKKPEILESIRKTKNKYPHLFERNQIVGYEFLQNLFTQYNIPFSTELDPMGDQVIIVPSKFLAFKILQISKHSELKGIRYKDNQKISEFYQTKGVRLLQLFEQEIFKKPKIARTRIKHYLGLIPYRVYARKCEVKTIEPNLKNKFLNKYHVQGRDFGSGIGIGLYYKNRLISVMSFIKHKNKPYELSRFSGNSLFNVVGGASKMLSFFEKLYKTGDILPHITSFADRRWSGGNVYEKLGFILTKQGVPSYLYFEADNIKLFHKFSFRKDNLKRRFPNFKEELSEFKNMELNGWDRIWDCGLIKYEKNIEPITEEISEINTIENIETQVI